MLHPKLTMSFQAATRFHAFRRLAPTRALSAFADAQRIPTNQELVEQRLENTRARKAVQEQMKQAQTEKNLHIHQLIHSQPKSEYVVPPLYAVKVWVDDVLREELKLNGREKRGRVFIEAGTNGVLTKRGLDQELHEFFRALRKQTFQLSANIPTVAEDGSIRALEDPTHTWPIETDDDVIRTFQAADEFYQQSSSATLQRPSIQINVSKDPNAPPPPPTPPYLEGMADPAETTNMTMMSFYSFPPQGIADPDAFAVELKKKWKPFGALGRIYVAQEGVNAQMSVPTNVVANFRACCHSIDELGEYMENDMNLDPRPLSMEEFAEAGVPTQDGKAAPPFRNLHIRVRNQIVADGLDYSLDWQSAGYDCPPMEWHQRLQSARQARQELGKNGTQEDNGDIPILLDCRNKYETDIGLFEGAEPLDTENFRESWDVLKERLKDTPKDAPLMTYCTGGIRCVKVGAYLTQEMGFTNVSRLAGGIIAYDRTVNEQTEGEESMFKGSNFVFDGRLGRPITEDNLAECVTCGAETNLIANCRNDNCHTRIVQCENCRTSFHGTCSEACRNRLVNGASTAQSLPKIDPVAEPSQKFTSLNDYSMGFTSPVPSIYNEMELNTQAYLPMGAHMVSGAAQGRMLTQLASMTREGRCLELGTFTGYATTCLLEGARNVGQVTGEENGNLQGGPFVLSMERDRRAFNLAAAHVEAATKHGLGEAGAEAACAVRGEVREVEDGCFSATMEEMAGCELHRVKDALAAVEAIADGTSDLKPAPFDLVFVDADKTRLLDYVEACLGNDRLLKRGGLIVVDNVLWKGLVLEACNGEFATIRGTEDTLRKNRRARKLATQMHQFNSAIVQDDRAEVMMLPMRDGLSVIRKR